MKRWHAKKAARLNVPTAELQSVAEQQEEISPLAPVRYPRRGRCRKGRSASAIRTSTRRSSGTVRASG